MLAIIFATAGPANVAGYLEGWKDGSEHCAPKFSEVQTIKPRMILDSMARREGSLERAREIVDMI